MEATFTLNVCLTIKLFFMKRLLLLSILLFAAGSSIAQNIQWMKWSDAIAANKKKPKLIFVDVYTNWCGWCKVMDNKTFSDPEVAKYMSENFYCVKLDAEQKEDITYNKMVFKYKTDARSHELAISLLDGQMSYPSFVFLNSKEQRITIIKGYQEAAVWLQNLKSIVATVK